jgi:hypothetical protein
MGAEEEIYESAARLLDLPISYSISATWPLITF